VEIHNGDHLPIGGAKVPVDNDELLKRVEAIETAQAVQEANLAGAQATQAAAQAGMSATGAAMQAGNMAAMVIGSVALVTGLFLGITIAHAKR
jgi:hypothetical protein